MRNHIPHGDGFLCGNTSLTAKSEKLCMRCLNHQRAMLWILNDARVALTQELAAMADDAHPRSKTLTKLIARIDRILGPREAGR